MSVSDWLSLTLVCILGAASPGPSLAVILSAVQTGGRAGGLAAAIGHGLGIFLYAFVAATSLSFIIAHHATLFFTLQLAGAVLLIWLGGRLLLASFRPKDEPAPASAQSGMSGSFLSGFAIAAFNPKIAAFFASLFSQFFAEGQSLGLHVGMATLTGAIDVATYVIIVIAVSGDRLQAMLGARLHLFERALGGLLVLIGVSLLITHFVTA
jgi:threonine/homoserine/homoserine lactone efflux protein